jgi:hypothetical protein
MFLAVLLAFVIALVVTAVFAPLTGRRYGEPQTVRFLILVFLATWAFGMWLTPVGPVVHGLPWFSFLVVAVIVAMMFAATGPRSTRRPPSPAGAAAHSADAAITTAFGAFFWILVALLLGVAFAGLR